MLFYLLISLSCFSAFSACSAVNIFLMIEHELARVEDRPEDVLQGPLLVGLGVDDALQLRLLRGARLAADAAQVQLVNDLARRLLGLEQLADQVALGDPLR